MDYRVVHGETDSLASPVWRALDELLLEEFPGERQGKTFTVARLAVDCGFRTQVVTSWAKRQAFPRVMAVKGSDAERQVMGSPTFTEYTLGGKRLKGGVKHYPIGVSLIKSELYGWLKIPAPTAENPEVPIGWCHFSTNVHTEEYFRQLTAERLEITTGKTGRRKYEWVLDHKRNEALDVRVYNRALAYQLGVDRWKRENAPTVASATAGGGTVRPRMPRAPAPPLRMPRPRPVHPLRPIGGRPRRLW
jgi:phage terminase large subunit GpA-like protein